MTLQSANETAHSSRMSQEVQMRARVLGAAEVMLSAEEILEINGKPASMDLMVSGGHSTK